MRTWVATLLARPWMPVAAALLGVVLTLPALGAGLLADDYIHRSILLGKGAVAAGGNPVFDLFAFVQRGPRREAALALGTLTWWAHPDLNLSLFRPVTALTHVLDYAIWPDAIAAQHLQSLLWYAAAVGLVGLLYRRVHGATAAAGLATVLFAVDDAHAMCAGWLANRHALVALTFGTVAMLAHVRWRRDGGTWWFVTAAITLTVALLASEAGIGAAAYLVAWELTMDERPSVNRAAALLPYGLLVIGWRLIYQALGYGASGSDLYVDPGHHPLDFLVALGERWPVLQLGQWTQVPIDLFIFLPRAGQLALTAVSVAVCLALAWLFAPLVIARREARFWAAGMVLSLVPLCAAFPMDRLLLFSGVGACGLLAVLAEQVGILPGPKSAAATGRRRLVTWALLLIHGPLAAALLVARVAALPLFAAAIEVGVVAAPADDDAPRQTYVFVTGHEFPVVYLAVIRHLETPTTAPGRVAVLSSLSNHNEVYREDDDTLVITARDGFLRQPTDQLLRSPSAPFRAGEIIQRPDFAAEVREVTPDGRPARVAFHFRAPLDNPAFRWLAWGPAGVEEFRLPAVGSSVEMPPMPIIPFLTTGGSGPARQG